MKCKPIQTCASTLFGASRSSGLYEILINKLHRGFVDSVTLISERCNPRSAHHRYDGYSRCTEPKFTISFHSNFPEINEHKQWFCIYLFFWYSQLWIIGRPICFLYIIDQNFYCSIKIYWKVITYFNSKSLLEYIIFMYAIIYAPIHVRMRRMTTCLHRIDFRLKDSALITNDLRNPLKVRTL